MGFQDINTFNLAMLAKKAWRLINQLNSLSFKVYKARYFPSCSFLEMELGSNLSYLWRTLTSSGYYTRRVKMEGGKWDLNWYCQTSVAASTPCFRRNGPWPSKVRELVDEDTKQWDRAKLVYWFEAHTCVDILSSTPLSNLYANDVLVWKENKSQTFSVKSAYGVAQRVLNLLDGDHSMASADGRLWKSVWSLNTPPKVWNFLWRACSNILPTRDNLCKKKVQLDQGRLKLFRWWPKAPTDKEAFN